MTWLDYKRAVHPSGNRGAVPILLDGNTGFALALATVAVTRLRRRRRHTT